MNRVYIDVSVSRYSSKSLSEQIFAQNLDNNKSLTCSLILAFQKDYTLYDV